MNTPPHAQSPSAPPPPPLHEHRMLKGEALGFGAIACLVVAALVAMQCNRPGQTPSPATVTATPLSTVVVVGPTQAPRTSTPRATATPRIGPLGSGGLLNR